ncbi:hypothetical protein BsIDN1_56010 [Bacillus safensis]|uniref:Thioesterase domain-containing protein n=1 Tax=Bacillus safensis TaxID=561879 RepID=A0A5S9MFV1_BACIA|nr:hypothetical protein BsIDN1_56010 [Bacillus safensis]
MDVSGSNTLLEALGIEIVECNKSRCVATMPVDHRTKQPFGLLHGGASAALAETVASMGAAAHLDLTQQVCSGIEINANHLKICTRWSGDSDSCSSTCRTAYNGISNRYKR